MTAHRSRRSCQGLLRRCLQDRQVRHQGPAEPVPARSAHPTTSRASRKCRVPSWATACQTFSRLQDVADLGNALYGLVNNMSIASGPQVVVNDDRLAPTTRRRRAVSVEALARRERPDGHAQVSADQFFQSRATPRSCWVSTRSSRRSPMSCRRFLATSLE